MLDIYTKIFVGIGREGMKALISFDLKNKLDLPINYMHLIQAAIYGYLKEEDDYRQLHDRGYKKGNFDYKLFTFGYLQGQYKIQAHSIIFHGRVELEIRSVDEELIRLLARNIGEKGLKLHQYQLRPREITLSEKDFLEEEIIIYMKTPITVYHTEKESKKTIFYQPNELEFQELVVKNYVRKYEAYYQKPAEPIEIETLKFSAKDKVVTNYENFYITGWKGVYRLRASNHTLKFLYNVGLGGKNAQGFGMFEKLS